MTGTINLALVPAFVEVVRQGSFTKAAASLGLPKSTVSRRVARLEQTLGATLLVRTTRRLRLTPEGERFYAQVAPALERVEEASRALAAQGDEPQGVLRISVPIDFEHLPLSITTFVARYPEVTVQVNVTSARADLVAEGFDLAIRAGKLRDSSLIARRLASPCFLLFASQGYLDEHGSPQTVAQLHDHACVLFRPVNGVARWPLVGPSGLEEVEVRGRIHADDFTFVRGAVTAGAGIGLMPETFHVPEGSVQRVLPNHRVRGGDVHIVYPGSRHVPAKVRAFRDHLLETLPWGISEHV